MSGDSGNLSQDDINALLAQAKGDEPESPPPRKDAAADNQAAKEVDGFMELEEEDVSELYASNESVQGGRTPEPEGPAYPPEDGDANASAPPPESESAFDPLAAEDENEEKEERETVSGAGAEARRFNASGRQKEAAGETLPDPAGGAGEDASDERRQDSLPASDKEGENTGEEELFESAAGDDFVRLADAQISPEDEQAKTGRARWRKSRLLRFSAAAAVIVLLGGGVFFGYGRYRKAASEKVFQAPAASEAAVDKFEAPHIPGPVAGSKEPRAGAPAPMAKSGPAAESLDRAQRLEAALHARRAAIGELIAEYRRDIRQIEEELPAVSGRLSAEGVTDDPELRWKLETVRRRLGYIGQLEAYRRHLLLETEALHHAARRAQIDLQIVGWVETIRQEDLAKRLDAVIEERLRRLAADAPEKAAAEPPSIAAVWQDIQKRRNPDGLDAAPTGSPSNRARRSGEKAGASVNDPAVPAAGSEGGLDLSRIRRLTAEDARRLAQWPGKRLVLDGLTELSPDAARELSQWPGEVLSLNAIRRLSPEAKAFLSTWDGRRLEMMALQDAAPWKAAATVVMLPRGKG